MTKSPKPPLSIFVVSDTTGQLTLRRGLPRCTSFLLLGSAGANAQHGVRWAPANDAGDQWYGAKPAPVGLWTNENQAHYAQSDNNADNSFNIMYILFHIVFLSAFDIEHDRYINCVRK